MDGDWSEVGFYWILLLYVMVDGVSTDPGQATVEPTPKRRLYPYA